MRLAYAQRFIGSFALPLALELVELANQKLRDPIAKGQVIRLVGRIEAGNFGDHKFFRQGAWELRIDQGPG